MSRSSDLMNMQKRDRNRIYLSPPNTNEAEKKALDDALASGWIAPAGPELLRFEQQLSEYFNSKSVLLLNSGTAALHLSLVLAGVGEGDVVLTSSFTFAACANVIHYQNAIPVFIDSESDTWNIDPALLEEYLGNCTVPPKALIATHLYGVPAEIQQLKSICKRYGVLLIEDAAEALGAYAGTRPVGSFGDFGIVSFNGNKVITTSGGGALICSEDHYKNGLHLATQANRGVGEYDHDQVGYNYRLSNVLASLGASQFEKLHLFLNRKKSIFQKYREALSDYLLFPQEKAGNQSNYWLTTALLKDSHSPAELLQWLEDANIESRRLWKPLHLHKAYSKYDLWDQECVWTCLNQGSVFLQDPALQNVIRIL